jgi:short-subunit dehydrogenase
MLEKYGPYALVAGASGGLGAAYAGALAKRGFKLALLARRKEKPEAFAAELRGKYQVEIITCAVDPADFEAVKTFVSALDAGIGLLVYNAACAPVGLFKDIEKEQLSRIVAVNVRGPLLLARLALPKMIERKRGGIVLMSSWREPRAARASPLTRRLNPLTPSSPKLCGKNSNPWVSM